MGSGALFLWLLWWCSWLNPSNPFFGHQKSVNSVQLDGLTSTLISGSNDQTIGHWRVAGFLNPIFNHFIGDIGNSKKAIRVVRYRPVDNNIMAAGLENGEIQLWGITGSNGLIDTFSDQKDDRVFALEFTQDSRSLFSGHGSGLVLQWDTSFHRGEIAKGHNRLLKKKQFDFAVYDLKFVGDGNSKLAVAGRYNQFFIWNLSSDRTIKVPYPPGGQDDYILSLDVAEFAPYIVATGDNQGNITIWNVKNCMDGSGNCEVIDRWRAGKVGEAVRSVSLGDNACYLATGGDDAKVTLWLLNSEGKRARDLSNGQVIKKEVTRSYNGKNINSVHLKVINKNVLIASGSDDTQVRVNEEERRFDIGCDSQKNLNF
jgi:WD40 repeat protein